MKTILIIILILCSLTNPSYSSNHELSVEVKQLLDKSLIMRRVHLDSMKYFIDSALVCALRTRNYHDLYNSYLYYGYYYLDIQDFKESEINIKIAMNIALKENDSINIIRVYNLLGHFYHRQIKIAESSRYYLHALHMLNNIKNEDNLQGYIHVYTNLARNFYTIGKYNKSIEYTQKALDIAYSVGDTTMIISNLRQISRSYRMVNMTNDAFKAAKEALMLTGLKNFPDVAKAELYQLLGDLYLAQDSVHYDSSEYYLEKSIEAFKKSGRINMLIETQVHLAGLHYESGDFDLAKSIILEVLPWLKENGDSYLIELAYEILSKSECKLGNYMSAYKNLDTAVIYLDEFTEELDNEELDNVIEEFIAKECERDKNIIAGKLEIEELKTEKINSARKGFAIAFIVAIIILGMITSVYILYRKNATRKRQMNEQKLQSLKNEHRLSEMLRQATVDKLNVRDSLLQVINNHLLQQSMLSSKITKWLKSIKCQVNKKTQTEIQSYLAEMASYTVENNWQNFEKNFSEIHPGAQDKIRLAYPGLSQGDFRILCFIIMGMDNQEISMISMQSTGSIRSALFRLRNKFEVESNQELIKKLRELIKQD